jgi:hypothetical protein
MNLSKLFYALIPLALFLFITQHVHAAKPDPNQTPGMYCSESDPDFQEYRYSAHIAYCGRNVSESEKAQVAAAYGNIPKSEWSNYEFDHLIPLAGGGSNNPANIWPQPLQEAKVKDVLEDQIYRAFVAGNMTQDQESQEISDWINSHY